MSALRDAVTHDFGESLRGGAQFQNTFDALAEDDCESEDVASTTHQSELDSAQAESDADPKATSYASSNGRSYYADFLARKMELRGGAGGASATQNKKLTRR